MNVAVSKFLVRILLSEIDFKEQKEFAQMFK